MVEGSAIRPYVDGIWALNYRGAAGLRSRANVNLMFPEQPLFDMHGITQIAVACDNTSKTRALFEINKGSNRNPSIEVNAKMRAEDRRVPFP